MDSDSVLLVFSILLLVGSLINTWRDTRPIPFAKARWTIPSLPRNRLAPIATGTSIFSATLIYLAYQTYLHYINFGIKLSFASRFCLMVAWFLIVIALSRRTEFYEVIPETNDPENEAGLAGGMPPKN